MRHLRIPIVLAFVDDHSQHLGHCAVGMLHTTVAAWVVGAGGDFLNTKKLVDDVRKLGAEGRCPRGCYTGTAKGGCISR